jgi:hypothetical protein
MNFFGLNEEDGRFFSTPMIWIFVLPAVVLTVATFLLYSRQVKSHEKPDFRPGITKSYMGGKRFGDWIAMAGLKKKVDGVR